MDQSGIFECCICFNNYDYGHMKDKNVCTFCFESLPSNSLHPLKRTPIDMCVCGSKWNQMCAIQSLTPPGMSYTLCPKRLEACKTAAERRALVSDPTAFVSVVQIHKKKYTQKIFHFKYCDSHFKPSPYPCLSTMEHINTSTGRVSSCKATFPFPVV